MSYWHEPDATMHEKGCNIDDIRIIMRKIDDMACKMHREVDDTLVIISADHGHIDITEEIYLNEIPEIDECLIMPISMEARAVSLFIKPGMEKVFEERFNQYFNDDFILIPKDKVLSSEFSKGKQHRKVMDFIELHCVRKTPKMLRYRTLVSPKRHIYKGHHAGLTEMEMMVPLIILE